MWNLKMAAESLRKVCFALTILIISAKLSVTSNQLTVGCLKPEHVLCKAIVDSLSLASTSFAGRNAIYTRQRVI